MAGRDLPGVRRHQLRRMAAATSPQGRPPGFIHVHDDTTLFIPERPGNARFDGFHNILTNPHVGIMCIIPGRGDTLRINGEATIVANPPTADAMTIKGHRPTLALQVDIEEVFFHCPKAFRRAKTWEPGQWDPAAARSYAEVAMTLWHKDEPAEQVLAHYEDNVYNTTLYTRSMPAADPPTNVSKNAAATVHSQRAEGVSS